MVRVRFAPSPTGFLHVGGLRTALYSELFARKHDGALILRIEDTDQERSVQGGVENIIRTLKWAGIQIDEGPYLEDGEIRQKGKFGPYIQSQRLDIYKEHVYKLIDEGKAYRCFCCTERLNEMREKQRTEGGRTMYDRHCRDLSNEEIAAEMEKKTPYVVRLRVPETGVTSFNDAIRGTVEVANSEIDDQVLLKSDGFPTYHLANVVDDHLMGVTHVIRGEEWCPSTPKHVLLYEAFSWQSPEFAHLPLLLNADKSKLSKRQGDVAAEDYRNKGYLSEALINFIALLGWNPQNDREIYTKHELIAGFDLSKVNKGGAVFDLQKLDWMNGEYIKKYDSLDLAALALPFYERSGLVKRNGGQFKNAKTGADLPLEQLAKIVSVEQRRVKTLAEMPECTEFLFADRLEYDRDIIFWKKSTSAEAKNRLEGLLKYVEDLPEEMFEDVERLEKDVISFVSDQGWTNAESLWPMRVALTAKKASPSPFEVAWVLGKDATIARLRDALQLL